MVWYKCEVKWIKLILLIYFIEHNKIQNATCQPIINIRNISEAFSIPLLILSLLNLCAFSIYDTSPLGLTPFISMHSDHMSLFCTVWVYKHRPALCSIQVNALFCYFIIDITSYLSTQASIVMMH